jgi:DNA processing protein
MANRSPHQGPWRPTLRTETAGFPTDELLGPLNAVEQRNAPRVLFVTGDRTLLRRGPRVSIVGARKATEDALRRAARLSRALVEHGVTVVSGLAAGVDTAAHTATIEADGRTIAVLGTNLDEVFPRENAELQAAIAREHLLVSQFPSGYPTRRQNFPMRNRTMALLVDASVIVEAGPTSGSLSQGWEALRLGRTLFIMRSVVENTALTWPEQMLDYGAYVLTDVEDLLDRIPFDDTLRAFAL